jgi:hypothetical protein
MKSDRGHCVALAYLVPTPFHASSVGPIIIVAPRLGLGLGLLLGLGRLLVPAGLPYQARRCSYPGPDGRPLPSITADSTTDSAEGGATGRPAHCTALLGRRCGSTRLWLHRIDARLSFCPLMAPELILLELLLTLPFLWIGEDFRRHLTGDQAQSQGHVHYNTPVLQHISSSIMSTREQRLLPPPEPSPPLWLSSPGQWECLCYLGEDRTI